MNASPEVAQLGAAVLRLDAQAVADAYGQDTRALIDTLHAALASSQGVGLAAPQIGVSQRIIIVASRPNARYPDAPLMTPTVMINPVFRPLSDAKEKDWEGCLSVPGIRALVPRYKEIRVKYIDEGGKRIEKDLHDFIARIFQHEVDHLDGFVFLDRVESNRDIVSEREYFKLLS